MSEVNNDFQRIANETNGRALTIRDANDLPDILIDLVREACVATPVIPPSEDTSIPVSTPTSIPVPIIPVTPPPPNPWWSILLTPPWVWLLLLLLIPFLLLPLLFWMRLNNQNMIRRSVLASELPLPEPYTAPPGASSSVTRDPVPWTVPPTPGYQPALLIGLGKSGRWTLTHAKQTLLEVGERPSIDLLAFDMAERTTETSTEIAVLAALHDKGIISLDLQTEPPYELRYLHNSANQLIETVKQDPAAYPILARWIETDFEQLPHVNARLHFLANLQTIATDVTTLLETLFKRQGGDVFLVASLEEDIGLGTVLDCAQLIQMLTARLNSSIALHIWLYTPTTGLDAATYTEPVAWSTLRTLERLQTCFAQQPPTPPLFDWKLTGLSSAHSVTEWTGKLATSCVLISGNRDVNSLLTIPPHEGVYPMVADALCAMLETPATQSFREHRADVNTRIAQAQQQLDTALYSSWGAFTYVLRPAALVQEAVDQHICTLHTMLLAPSSGAPKDDLLVLADTLATGFHYPLSQIITTSATYPSNQAETAGILESDAVRGQLATHLRDDSLGNYIRRALFNKNHSTARSAYLAYVQTYNGDNSNPGRWREYIEAHATILESEFQDKLREHVLQILNCSSPGQLHRAQQFCSSLNGQLQVTEHTLDEKTKDLVARISQYSTDQDIAAELDLRRPSLWNKLVGKVTSAEQNKLFKKYQQELHIRLELCIVQQARVTCKRLRAFVECMEVTLGQHRTYIQQAYETATQSLALTRERRLQQIDRGAVQHEWGMPHTEVRRLRQYLSEHASLPTNKELVDSVRHLRAYLDGDHVAELIQTHITEEQKDFLGWVWEPDADGSNTLHMVYQYSANPAGQPRYLISANDPFRRFVSEVLQNSGRSISLRCWRQTY
ncbi:hypothetical protein HC928_03210 [bacterium]|nr:hypothetical protein [bacterium]